MRVMDQVFRGRNENIWRLSGVKNNFFFQKYTYVVVGLSSGKLRSAEKPLATEPRDGGIWSRWHNSGSRNNGLASRLVLVPTVLAISTQFLTNWSCPRHVFSPRLRCLSKSVQVSSNHGQKKTAHGVVLCRLPAKNIKNISNKWKLKFVFLSQSVLKW